MKENKPIHWHLVKDVDEETNCGEKYRLVIGVRAIRQRDLKETINHHTLIDLFQSYCRKVAGCEVDINLE